MPLRGTAQRRIGQKEKVMPVCDAPTSRNIPLPVQREVRQRCGFGCVICGLPLYEYEHLLGWANVHRHLSEEITLLCDQHHKEKTNGLLPIEDVMEANRSPYNLRDGVSKPYDLHLAVKAQKSLLVGIVSRLRIEVTEPFWFR
jgi:hypothetical protein